MGGPNRKTKKPKIKQKKKLRKGENNDDNSGMGKGKKGGNGNGQRKTYFRIKSAGNARPEKMQMKFRPKNRGLVPRN